MSKAFAYVLIVVSILGIAVSIYAWYLHAKPTDDTFCNFNETFNCDIVNKGEYSEIANIPVAAFGVLGYLGLVIGGFAGIRNRTLWPFIFAASAIGLAFALYLTYIEAFVLHAYCIVCLASQLLILAACVASFVQYRRARKFNSTIHDSNTL